MLLYYKHTTQQEICDVKNAYDEFIMSTKVTSVNNYQLLFKIDIYFFKLVSDSILALFETCTHIIARDKLLKYQVYLNK